MSLTQSFLDHGSKKRTEDSANASSRVGKRARTGEPNVKPKRQKRTEKSQASTRTKIGKSTRKVGWRAAEDNGSFRSAAERSAKKEKWEGKLSRCKNAFAKNIVENAFAAETPAKWTGKRFAERPLTKEKKRVTGSFGQAMVGRGTKTKPKNLTATKIEERWNTYGHDALRYAKVLSKAESFENRGRKRKMDVKVRILARIDQEKTKELAEHGF